MLLNDFEVYRRNQLSLECLYVLFRLNESLLVQHWAKQLIFTSHKLLDYKQQIFLFLFCYLSS
jgi:hypothetical protein